MQPFLDQQDEDALVAEALLRDLEALTGRACAECRRSICGHEVLFSVALGAKDAPRCASCLAATIERNRTEMRDELVEHFRHRSCYSQAWNVACDREGQPRSFRPACLMEGETTSARLVPASRSSDKHPLSDVWDAGDMACGELVLALRIRLNALPGGSVLQVTACDPAAPLDLPAWCRLTGHRLLRSEHPHYVIQRKES